MTIVKAYELERDSSGNSTVKRVAREGTPINCYFSPNGRLYVDIEHNDQYKDNIDYEFAVVKNGEENKLRGFSYIGLATHYIIHGNTVVVQEQVHIYYRPNLIYIRD